jgi:hypothetical protein
MAKRHCTISRRACGGRPLTAGSIVLCLSPSALPLAAARAAAGPLLGVRWDAR